MTDYIARPSTDIPKREAPERTFDQAGADKLLAIVSESLPDELNAKGVLVHVFSTASDGATYADAKAARLVVNKAKRLLARVAPDGQVVKTAIFEPVKGVGSFEWRMWLIAAPAEVAAPAAKAGKAK